MDKKITIQTEHWGYGFIITIYCILKPIYLFESGSLQICDWFLVVSFLYYLIEHKGKLPLPRKRKNIIMLFLVFWTYELIVNISWYLIYQDMALVKSIIFYFFNFFAFYFVLLIEMSIGTKKTITAFAHGCFFSSLVALSGAVANMGKGIRNMGWFNNPNQLGYYAVVIITGALLYADLLKREYKVLMIAVSLWLIFVSGSKAAFLGVLIMLFLYIVAGNVKITRKRIMLLILLIILMFIALYFIFLSSSSWITSNSTIMYMRKRMLNMASESDTNLGSGRGYNRVFEMGKNILWGMGEGAYYRFNSLTGKEIHSTYVNCLVSYGLIGFAIMGLIWGKILYKKETLKRTLICLSGILLYSITHNGIRNTLLWIMFATIYIDNYSYFDE